MDILTSKLTPIVWKGNLWFIQSGAVQDTKRSLLTSKKRRHSKKENKKPPPKIQTPVSKIQKKFKNSYLISTLRRAGFRLGDNKSSLFINKDDALRLVVRVLQASVPYALDKTRQPVRCFMIS